MRNVILLLSKVVEANKSYHIFMVLLSPSDRYHLDLVFFVRKIGPHIKKYTRQKNIRLKTQKNNPDILNQQNFRVLFQRPKSVNRCWILSFLLFRGCIYASSK